MRILLAEDDAMVGKAVRQGLAQASFVVDWVTDGREAELSLANGVYDLADMLGISRQMLNVELRRMERAGIVTLGRSRIEVLDRSALNRLGGLVD